jgi:hypothetical protein
MKSWRSAILEITRWPLSLLFCFWDVLFLYMPRGSWKPTWTSHDLTDGSANTCTCDARDTCCCYLYTLPGANDWHLGWRLSPASRLSRCNSLVLACAHNFRTSCENLRSTSTRKSPPPPSSLTCGRSTRHEQIILGRDFESAISKSFVVVSGRVGFLVCLGESSFSKFCFGWPF